MPAGAASQVKLRLWPAILLVAIMGLMRDYGRTPGELDFIKIMLGFVVGPLVVFLGTFIWWSFFSRLPRSDHMLAIGIPLVVFVAAIVLCNAKFRGTALITVVVPLLG